MSCIHSYETEITLAVEVSYCGTPGSRGYSTLAEGQLDPDSDPEVEILSVSVSKFDGRVWRQDVMDYLPDEVFRELEREIEAMVDTEEA